MTEPDWGPEIGVDADEAALEAELATQLDAEGSALTNRNALSSFWGVVKQVVFKRILALEQLLVDTAPMGFLTHSAGVWLDEKLKEFGKTRNPAVTAQGNITFCRTGTTGNVNIPAGTIVSTQTLADGTTKRFVSLADTLLADRLSSVDLLCEAEAEGIAAAFLLGAAAASRSRRPHFANDAATPYDPAVRPLIAVRGREAGSCSRREATAKIHPKRRWHFPGARWCWPSPSTSCGAAACPR